MADNNNKSSDHEQHTNSIWGTKHYIDSLGNNLRTLIHDSFNKLDKALTTHLKNFEDFTTEFKEFTSNVTSDALWE